MGYRSFVAPPIVNAAREAIFRHHRRLFLPRQLQRAKATRTHSLASRRTGSPPIHKGAFWVLLNYYERTEYFFRKRRLSREIAQGGSLCPSGTSCIHKQQELISKRGICAQTSLEKSGGGTGQIIWYYKKEKRVIFFGTAVAVKTSKRGRGFVCKNSKVSPPPLPHYRGLSRCKRRVSGSPLLSNEVGVGLTAAAPQNLCLVCRHGVPKPASLDDHSPYWMNRVLLPICVR